MKLKIDFNGKQNKLEAENCSHGYEADVIMIRGDKMYIGEGAYMREVDLNKPIKNFKIKLSEGK